MDKIFLRNYLIFAIILTGAAGVLSYVLLYGGDILQKTEQSVAHTYEVIVSGERISNHVESILAAQRAYLITDDKDFLQEYETKKAHISENIATLSDLTKDNEAQQSRLHEIRNHLSNLIRKLEERTLKIDVAPSDAVLNEVEIIDKLRKNIIRINSSFLAEEHGLLDARMAEANKNKRRYKYTVLISLIVGTSMLLLLNGYLFYAQRKRNAVELALKSTEDRFAMAIEGTQDGIFDWDIANNQIFYSQRFFEMLGYERKVGIGTLEDYKEMVHPEDSERLWRNMDLYLEGKLSEYIQEFRMKNAYGRWVWIQARAKASYDKKGKAKRMVGAHTDISYLKLEQEKLEKEKRQAEDANRAKTDFLAHMSHEIRTPLTAISGIAEIMERRQSNLDSKQKQLVQSLKASSSSLKDLVNDILDFSKIESGDLELKEEHFNLVDMFEGIISIMALRASEKGISFVFDYEAVEGTELYSDKIRLRQILINLIGNAIKFTDTGGVTIKADFEQREDQDFMLIEIADTGIGISSENFDLIFERFKQANSSVSRKYGGTGLGLSISRNLARLMGGDIFLSSETGNGSTFTVLLPLKAKTLKGGRTTTLARDQETEEPAYSLLGTEKKVLLVEDYEGNIVVIGYILEDMGLDYDVARTGVEALELWQKNQYNVVLMDVQMPEMDGFTATQQIRRMEKEGNLEHTPIIGMTAHAQVGDKEKCIECGMDVYLPKPLVEDDLKAEIFKHLRHKRKAA
ncbi:MAG: response regulator [Alphaproteobacteria bacterium]|nr:response regulator [Alphaproteobacteria bacterium]